MLQLKKASEVRMNNDWHYRESNILYNVQGCSHLVAILHKRKYLYFLEDKRIWDRKELERWTSKETGKYASVSYFVVT